MIAFILWGRSQHGDSEEASSKWQLHGSNSDLMIIVSNVLLALRLKNPKSGW